jgi:hypothetical protein
MRVAIVHYHLRVGGVTGVIEATSAALTAAGVRHVVLSGEAPSASTRMPVAVVDGLGYPGSFGSLDKAGERSAALAVRLRAAAAGALGAAADVWHFHNHALGKSPLTGRVVECLARDGEAMVLQCHDFAEDGRPENLAVLGEHEWLYPVGPRICYAFLNASDRARLIGCGLSPEQARLLPNPLMVRSPALPPPDPAGEPLVFYPVRAIPRKNIGELLLLAALSPAGTRYAISRAPDNPAWLDGYHAWQRLADELRLPVGFGVVDRQPPPGTDDASFGSWVRHSSHFVTTSVAEGFGMVFLEAAAEGRPLFGRNLPRVTADHAAAGLPLGRLYDALVVGDAGGADFGGLPPERQQAIIRQLGESPAAAGDVRVRAGETEEPAVRWLAETLQQREVGVEASRLAGFSPAACAARVAAIYREVAAGTATGRLGRLGRGDVLAAFQRRG